MWRRGVAWVAGLTAGLGMAAAGAHAQVSMKEGVQVRLGGTVHVQYEASTLGTPGDGRSFMELRRLRPRVDFTIDGWITGRIEPDFAQGRARIRHGFLDFALSESLGVRAGSYKKPFGALQLTSSTVIPVIERGVRIAGLNEAIETRLGEAVALLPDGRVIPGEQQSLLEAFGHQGYAIGVSLHGDAAGADWEVGAFDGPSGEAAGGGRRNGAAARVVFGGAIARIGASASWSQLDLEDSVREGMAGGIDLGVGQPGRPGAGLLAEVNYGASLAGDDHGDFAAFQAITWLHLARPGRVAGLEPLLRMSWGDPDRSVDDNAGLLITPGFNIYVGGGNRLMFNWDVWMSESDVFGTESAFRAQAQVNF
jgi:hypothetical protein